MRFSKAQTLVSSLILTTLFLGNSAFAAKKPKVDFSVPPQGYVTAAEKIQATTTPAQTLVASGDVHVTYGKNTSKYRANLVLEGPNKLKMILWDSYERMDFDFAADGSQASWWKRRANRVKTIVQDDKSLKKALRLPIGIPEFIARLLIQNPPPSSDGKAANYYAFYSQSNGGTKNNYPTGIIFQFTKPKVKVWIDVQEADFGGAISAEKFKLDPHD